MAYLILSIVCVCILLLSIIIGAVLDEPFLGLLWGILLGLLLMIFGSLIIAIVQGVIEEQKISEEVPVKETPILEYTTNKLPSVLDKPIIMKYNQELETVEIEGHLCVYFKTSLDCFSKP